MLLQLDGTFVVQIINFVLFWVLLNYLYIIPTRRAMEARRDYIAGLAADAERFEDEAGALIAQANAKLDQARRTADGIMRAAAADAASQVGAIETKTAERVNEIVMQARSTVEAERTKALAESTAFVRELAAQMAERAIAGADVG
jgi:F-type H+-transporting ATPase subunit b